MTAVSVPSQQVILRTKGVGKIFGKFVALNNISAEFTKGAITSIIGPKNVPMPPSSAIITTSPEVS